MVMQIKFGTDLDFLNGNLGVTIGRDSVNGTFTGGSNIPEIVPAGNIYTLSYTEDEGCSS